MAQEPEYVTRKKRIDKKLTHLGWNIIDYKLGMNTSDFQDHAVCEYPTASGPADYALFVEGTLLGIIEAKKVSISGQNAMEQAKRYAKGVVHTVGSWNGYLVPFLYSSNGELVFYLDVRNGQNLNREIADFHSAQALKELYARNNETAFNWFRTNENKNPRLRPYQKNAIDAIEKAVTDGRRRCMVAMATGSGKTFTTVDSIYRLIKSGYAKRILFLVDRKSLAAQATVAFAAYETPQQNKFNQEYEVYSQRFRKEDFEEDVKFDVSVLPNEYLTKPDATKTFVYVSTIQRMAINLLGKEAIFNSETNDNDIEDATDKLDIPIHAFDVIIADECHRGYTSHDSNVWRKVLDYFDAVKIGLTATPAAHTVAYFGKPIFRYIVEDAIEQSLTPKMGGYIRKLQWIKRNEIAFKLKKVKGVYIFYEKEIPVYVGKTDNLRRRLNEHARQKSTHNDANLAFKIAKLEWTTTNKLEKKITRKILQEIKTFKAPFAKAKNKVAKMRMRFVEIENPYDQYLFEFYAALYFKTKYNDFNNH